MQLSHFPAVPCQSELPHYTHIVGGLQADIGGSIEADTLAEPRSPIKKTWQYTGLLYPKLNSGLLYLLIQNDFRS